MKGHDKSVDWWAAGAVMYEMLVGQGPFPDERSITKHREGTLACPEHLVSRDAANLINGLLHPTPHLRLGIKGGFQEIQQHSFFRGLDFDDLLERKLPPPIPIRMSNAGLGNFNIEEFDSSDSEEDEPRTIEEDGPEAWYVSF
ncbi:hypothetical protein CYMTET_34814 [Cymbomonas tetramitiformis]|uniref:Protein kinase domain-containing protein n=1 Tax=Cymbomonas tetramitiformis TaxID=36881 RepID=A0AAE0FAD5_9CHLO|nr:hypothetical protein CYMTET_34814 [Cymbomonas tetramitiformis]